LKQEIAVKHEFVQFIPEELTEGTVYISIRFATVAHLCACGCKTKVVTPVEANRLETDFRRQDDFARSFNRELEVSVPLALLDQEQQGALGGRLVSGADRREQDL
jgi:hypothetical protein